MLCSLCGHDIDASVTHDVRDSDERDAVDCVFLHARFFLIASFSSTILPFHCWIFFILWEDVALFLSLVTTLTFLWFLILTHVVSI